MKVKRKRDEDIENNNPDFMPHVLWLAVFKKYDSDKIEPRLITRQFYSPGFYESYDTVMSFAEKSNLEVFWFKEKKNFVNHPYYSRIFPFLESYCTYCNKKYNETEPIPCIEDCLGEFCSRLCLFEHIKLKHKSVTKDR